MLMCKNKRNVLCNRRCIILRWCFFLENHPVHAMLKNSICHKFCKWMDIALKHTIVRSMDVCFGEEENRLIRWRLLSTKFPIPCYIYKAFIQVVLEGIWDKW